MNDRDARITATMHGRALPAGRRHALPLTDQSAFFGGETEADRSEGCILDHLAAHIDAAPRAEEHRR
jgi:hypothetical protein